MKKKNTAILLYMQRRCPVILCLKQSCTRNLPKTDETKGILHTAECKITTVTRGQNLLKISQLMASEKPLQNWKIWSLLKYAKCRYLISIIHKQCIQDVDMSFSTNPPKSVTHTSNHFEHLIRRPWTPRFHPIFVVLKFLKEWIKKSKCQSQNV